MEVLHSNITGQGKPLIILHGFLGMSDNWKTLGNKYAEKGFEVHMIDQRNHGKSFHSEDFDYDLLVADLFRYMEFHGLENADVLGHSMGGKTAMFFATAHPDKVDRLIVADIAPKYYRQHHQDILAGLNALDLNVVRTRQDAENVLSEYVPDFGTRQFLLKNLYWISKEQLAFRFNLDILTKNIENIGKALPEDAIFNGKTLFVHGDRSGYIKPDDLPLLKHHFPQASLITITNAGHWLHAENPTMFFDETISFLTI